MAATNEQDERLWISPGGASNYGKCVHLWAPGAQIESADNDSDTATQYRSGTSQAVPFVAGAIALYLQNASGGLFWWTSTCLPAMMPSACCLAEHFAVMLLSCSCFLGRQIHTHTLRR